MNEEREEIRRRLEAPFPPQDVQWRVGVAFWAKSKGEPKEGDTCTGSVLCYIDARDVMNRLDDVIGFGNWSSSQEVMVSPNSVRTHKSTITINFQDGYQMHQDLADESQFEGIKGGSSDSLKRCAVRFGIGRYLYGMGDTKAKLCHNGRDWKIDTHEFPRLIGLLPAPENTTRQPDATMARNRVTLPQDRSLEEGRVPTPGSSSSPVLERDRVSTSTQSEPIDKEKFSKVVLDLQKRGRVLCDDLYGPDGGDQWIDRYSRLKFNHGVSSYKEIETRDRGKVFVNDLKEMIAALDGLKK